METQTSLLVAVTKECLEEMFPCLKKKKKSAFHSRLLAWVFNGTLSNIPQLKIGTHLCVCVCVFNIISFLQRP